MKIGSAHLGKKLSKETRRKLSESLKITYANPVLRKQMSERNKGRKATDETKRKMSIARKGKTTGMLGNKHSEETKMKISKKTSGKNNPNYGKKHSDIALEKIRSARDKQVFPRKDSKPELLVQSILLKNNINFTTKNKPTVFKIIQKRLDSNSISSAKQSIFFLIINSKRKHTPKRVYTLIAILYITI